MKHQKIRNNKFTDRFDKAPQLITNGIDELIWRSMVKAIDTRNKELEKTLFDFMQSTIHLSIQHHSLSHFNHYINFPARIYEMTAKKNKLETTYYESHKESTERSVIALRNLISFVLGAVIRNEKIIEKRDHLYYFYYWSFTSYSLFFYSLFRRNDLDFFKYTLRNFYLISDPLETELQELRAKKRNALNDLSNPDIEELYEVSKPLEILRRFGLYRRRCLKSIYSWIIYMYQLEEIELKVAQEYLNQFKPFDHIGELVTDLFFYSGNELSMNYMGLSGWDYIQRNDWEVYSPPQPSEWLTLGAVAEMITTKHYPNFARIKTKDINKASGIMVMVQKVTKEMQKKEDRWLDFFKLKSETFLERINAVQASIMELDKVKERIREEKIAQSQLSDKKKEALINDIGASWEKQSQIHWLFDKIGNTQIITDENTKLKLIGRRNYLPKGKMMLIDNEYYQRVYGLSDLGGNIGRWEDDDFFATALNSVKHQVTGISIVETIEKSLALLNENDVNPDLILLSPEYSYQDDELLQHEDFSLPNERKNDTIPFLEIGRFKNILIYGSFSNLIENKVLICNFKDAFLMRYKTKEKWYKGKLNIEFKELSKEEESDKFKKELTALSTDKREEGDLFNLIRSSIYLDIWTTLDFHIRDENSYVIGYVS